MFVVLRSLRVSEMKTTRNPAQEYKEALQIAKDFGLRIGQKGEQYSVYRIVTDRYSGGTRAVFLGQRRTVSTLRRFVGKCAGV